MFHFGTATCFHFGTAMRVHFGTTVRFHWGTSMRDAEEISRLQNGQDQRNHTKTQGTPTSYRHIWTGCRACQAILILHLQLHFGTAMPLCASILGPLCASTGGRIYARCGGNLQATKWSGPKKPRKHKAHSEHQRHLGRDRFFCMLLKREKGSTRIAGNT